MKNLFFLAALALVGQVQAQTKFEAAILKGKKLFAEASSPEGYLKVVNYFDRIAQKETGEWLPLYYQAQAYAISGANEPDVDKKEAVLNQGLEKVKAARVLSDHPEILVLEGFIQMLRLTVDPATRGQTLSPVIFGLFNQALAVDADNPRALLFSGQMQYGTAQFFGAGVEEACAYIQRAYDIFEKQGDTETIYPDWGMGAARATVNSCNQ